MADVSGSITKLIGAFVLILIGVALLPEIYTAIASMVLAGDVPTWLTTILGAVIGVGVVFLIWKAVDN